MLARLEGREVGIVGNPTYLTKMEMQQFKEELINQTRMCHFLTIKEMGMIVLCDFYFFNTKYKGLVF
jgi:hypothetical protein